MAKYESPFADLFNPPLPGQVVDDFLFELQKFAAFEEERAGRASAYETLKLASAERALGRAKMARVDRQRPPSLLEKLALAQAGARALLEPSPEQVALAEQQGLLAQTMSENQALKGQLQDVGGALEEHATAAEQAGQQAAALEEQLQGAEMQAQETQMQAQQAMAQAQEAQTMAQVSEQNAAQQADGKMRLAIRIQQMRQNLADLASQDPVSEEGEEADPIETQTQQMGGTPEELAMQEEAAAAEGGAPKPKADKPKPAAGTAEKTSALQMKLASARLRARYKLAAPVSLAKGKGLVRSAQHASGSHLDALGGAYARTSGREALVRQTAMSSKNPVYHERAKRVADQLKARKDRLEQSFNREYDVQSAYQARHGSRTVKEAPKSVAPVSAPVSAPSKPTEAKAPWSNKKKLLVGGGAATGVGAAGAGTYYATRDRKKAAANTAAATGRLGLNRLGQLLSGSRIGKLEGAAQNATSRAMKHDAAAGSAQKVKNTGVVSRILGRKPQLEDTVKSKRLNELSGRYGARAEALSGAAKSEANKVLAMQIGAGAAGAGGIGAGYAATRKRDRERA